MSLQQRIEQDEQYLDPAFWAHDAANAPEPEHYEPNDEDAVTASDIASYVPLTPEQEYEAMAASSDHVEDVLTAAFSGIAAEIKDKHDWLRFMTEPTGEMVAPEMVIDELFPTGRIVISGTRGIGKTVTLAPLALSATGLMPDYPLQSKIRRKVVYLAEDTDQVWRVIKSLQKAGWLTKDSAEIRKWFFVVPSKRLTPEEISEAAKHLKKLTTDNQKLDGGNYPAGPLLVVDTIAANVIIDRIEDNALHSQMHTAFRESFEGISTWLVTHVVKKAVGNQSRKRPNELSAIGGQSLEADANGTAYIFEDNHGRCLVVGKDRVEIGATVFDIETRPDTFDAIDVLGHPTTMTLRFNYLKRVDPVEVAKRAKEAAAEEAVSLRNAILAHVKGAPGCNQKSVTDALDFRKEDVVEEIERLIATKKLRNDGGEGKGKTKVLHVEDAITPAGMPDELINDKEVNHD